MEIRTILEYVNDTDIGYVDNNVMSMIQAWEILANKEGAEYKISEGIKELKSKLKPIISEWHKNNPTFDKAIISQRISDSLNWDKTINRLNNLLDQFGFNRDVLEVDFKSLVSWRHKVAHEGMIRGEDNKLIANKLLDAQFAFRILLLRKVGYTGKVLPNKGQYEEIDIKHYFV